MSCLEVEIGKCVAGGEFGVRDLQLHKILCVNILAAKRKYRSTIKRLGYLNIVVQLCKRKLDFTACTARKNQ